MGEEQGATPPGEDAKLESAGTGSWAFTDTHSIVDQQIQAAVARGEFDNLPLQGKPLPAMGDIHDPDWWLKQLVEREQITLLPPSLQLRRDDAELVELLDRQSAETEARSILEDFNQRVIACRYSNIGGPPLITMPKDVEAELAAWRVRREQRISAAAPADETAMSGSGSGRRRKWWRAKRR